MAWDDTQTGADSITFTEWNNMVTYIKSGVSAASTISTTALDNANWLGDTTITTLGTIGTGVWQGTAITSTYISDAATWNAKQDALTPGTDYLEPSTIAASYAPVLGADENYVSDAQLVVIGNTSGTNSGDQTSMSGISDTKANFDSSLSDGSFAYSGGAFHDGFSDYVANEHIDWTTDQGATNIDPGNYTNTTYTASDFNHDDLSNITGTASQYNHPTDAQMTVLGNTSGTNTGDQDVVDDTTPQLGGNLDWNGKALFIAGQTVGGSDGNLVYLSGADTWTQADADAEASCSKQLGIRLSSTTVLTHGIWTTTGLTAGSIYYASATAGGITTTAPSTTGQIVRIVGTALTTTELFFNPDMTFVEV